MAAPIAASITLPSDTGNSGKKNRTQSRSVSGSTVHEHFVIPGVAYEVVSKFFFSSAQQTVSATVQDATATGFFWFQLPSTVTISAVVRRLAVGSNAGSALATPTAPRLAFTKFTFTGTASGATVSPVTWRTAGTAAQGIIRTAVTGMTVTLVGAIGHFDIPTAETGAGVFYGEREIIPHNPLAFARGQSLELAAGEGIVIYQDIAGTTSDTRKFTVQMEWDECDLT